MQIRPGDKGLIARPGAACIRAGSDPNREPDSHSSGEQRERPAS